jgi:histidine phosphotransferase ChpT
MSATVIKLTPSSLAALLCSRICHDLISPVGALGTGIEILNDESNTDMHDDAIDLIKNSSRQANAKLNFLRDAFGAAGSAPGIIPVSDIKTKTENMYADGKATFNWQLKADGLEKARARMLLNLIMLAVGAIPRGGEVTISDENDGAILTLTSQGRRARLDPNVEKALSGKAPDDGFDGRTIQPFYTGMIARELQGSISTTVDEETVTFTATTALSAPA